LLTVVLWIPKAANRRAFSSKVPLSLQPIPTGMGRIMRQAAFASDGPIRADSR
jgi:hypothetical protein